MDHGETVKEALARELNEEVGLRGDFTYKIIANDDPYLLTTRNLYQVRLIFRVVPDQLPDSTGTDGDEIAFVDPSNLKNSTLLPERLVFTYSQLID